VSSPRRAICAASICAGLDLRGPRSARASICAGLDLRGPRSARSAPPDPCFGSGSWTPVPPTRG